VARSVRHSVASTELYGLSLITQIMLILQVVRGHHQTRRDAGRAMTGMIAAAPQNIESLPGNVFSKSNKSMIHVDQPLQFDLKQLTLRVLRLTVRAHRFDQIYRRFLPLRRIL